MKQPPAHIQLLFGPYHPPPLKRGDKAFCLYRDRDVVITGWSDTPISWPRCRPLGCRGGSGLLVDEELARAVRQESSLAIQWHWGVSVETVWAWRKALGVERVTAGSEELPFYQDTVVEDLPFQMRTTFGRFWQKSSLLINRTSPSGKDRWS